MQTSRIEVLPPRFRQKFTSWSQWDVDSRRERAEKKNSEWQDECVLLFH